MFQQAVKLDQKVLTDNRSKFILVHSSSGFKHSLKGNPTFINFIVCLFLQLYYDFELCLQEEGRKEMFNTFYLHLYCVRCLEQDIVKRTILVNTVKQNH